VSGQPSLPTGRPEVDAALRRLLTGVAEALGEQLVGLYLYGSLASGDFDPATSDLDFLVLTDGPLAPTRVDALARLHARLLASGDRWAAHLEGSYLPLAELPRWRRDGPEIPHVNEGRFYLARHGPDWVIQRWVLRTYPLAVHGPPLPDLVEPVGPDEIRASVAETLRAWWAPMLADPARLATPEYRAFAVLTMCRAWHALAGGAIVSKPAAAAWAREQADRRWADLIDAAVTWRPGEPLDRLDDVLALIRFALALSEAPPA
jgi:predicted nucleotidyltransferase